MGVSVGYPVLLSLLWTIQGTLSYHVTPERDESQTELTGESSCAFETAYAGLPPGWMKQEPWLRDYARIAPTITYRLAAHIFSPPYASSRQSFRRLAVHYTFCSQLPRRP